jgi:hypothetical protein
MQKEDVGHETTARPCVPLSGVSTLVGADQLVPFQRDTPSTASVATQKVADAHATVTAAPVRGSIVCAADQPGGSGGPKLAFRTWVGAAEAAAAANSGPASAAVTSPTTRNLTERVISAPPITSFRGCRSGHLAVQGI